MQRFIPYEKLSKREKKRRDNERRQDWGQINPLTRKKEDRKVYNRKRNREWGDERTRGFLYIAIVA